VQPPVLSGSVMGDTRSDDSAGALWTVTSADGLTMEIDPFEVAFLTRVANRIVDKVRGIKPVIYDPILRASGTHRVGVTLCSPA
jgi:GMP synthase (glutamine-hydrolysing)